MVPSPCVIVPYFGTLYRGLLDRWALQYSKSGATWPWTLVVPEPMDLPYPAVVLDVSRYQSYMRAGQAFDLKGALVCTAAEKIESFLALDVDAFVQKDFAPHIRGLGRVPVALPWDYGAYAYGRHSMLDSPYSWCPKRCAGVMWFGEFSLRAELLSEYRKAWTELRGLMPWTPPLPHLLEQYAWSVACERMHGGELPIQMNWSPHIFGSSATASIYHYLGKNKLRA